MNFGYTPPKADWWETGAIFGFICGIPFVLGIGVGWLIWG